jgi:gliding motility-associated-like protein
MNSNGEEKSMSMLRFTKGILLTFFTCTMIFAQAQVEICDNGIDDDGDGLVDAFDPDCPCDDVILICEPSCEFSVPGDALSFSVQWSGPEDALAYQTPLVADINNDGIPDVIVMTTDDIQVNEPRRSRNLRVLSGLTGQPQLTINTPFLAWVGPTPIAIADIDGDGFAEVFVASVDHTSNPLQDRRYLYCYNHDGSLRWKSNEQYGYLPNARFGSSIGLADFNNDGIPEIYVYNQIFNAQTGVKLVEGGNESGLAIMTTESFGAMANPVAVDLTPNPGLELACGNTVYEVLITNTNGISGNTMNAITIQGRNDGFTSIADIDLDGELDVIVATRGGTADLYVWNPRGTPSVIASRSLPNTGGNWTGLPFVGDMDNDCTPEIGVTRSRRVYALKYNGTPTLQLKWTLVTSDVSGFTGITMFDFNQDGKSELVYRDETNLRIIDGSGNTAVDIATFECISGTGAEMPVVADVDGDGQAEICVTCGINSINVGSVNLFGPMNQAWAPCRKIWNQYSYHNVNINNDLSIPIQQQPHQTLFSNVQCPFTDCNENRPFNTFLQQATTYTQDGCPVYLATDLQLSFIGQQECNGSDIFNITLNIKNVGDVNADSGAVVSFYNGNPFAAGATLINTIPQPVTLTQLLTPGDSLNIPVSIDISSLPKPFNLFVVLNDNGSQIAPITFPITSYPECDYNNNVVSITGVDCCEFGDLAIDGIGPAILEICSGSSITLEVSAGSSQGINTNDIVWTLPSGGNIFGESITVNQGGAYQVAVTDNALCTVDTFINVVLVPLPTTANAGNNIAICSESFNLQGNNPSVGTGQWIQITGSGNIVNPASPNSAVNNVGVGVNRFVWTITNGQTCVSSDTVAVTRIPFPDQSVAGSDAQVCDSAFGLNGNFPLIGTGTWSVISGQGTFDDVNAGTTNVNNLAPGNNVFQWTISNGICPPSTSQITITRFLPPSEAIAGVNQDVCGNTATLIGNIPVIGIGTWALISGNGDIINPASNQTAVSNLTTGANVFEYTIVNGTCPPSAAQVTINSFDASILADAGVDQQICTSSAQLGADVPSAGLGTWTIVSGSGDISNVNQANATITNLGLGSNIFRWTLVNGPCTTFDDVIILRDTPPSAAVTGPNQQICDNTASLSAQTPATGTGLWILIEGSGDIFNANNANTLVNNLLPGINVFQWTVSNGVCPPTTAQQLIQVDEIILADAGVDQQVCSDAAMLNATPLTQGAGTWTLVSGAGNIANVNAPNSQVSGLGFGNNIFRWTVENGTCTSQDEVIISRDQLPSVADAGLNQQVCGSTAQLNANIPTVGTGSWSLISGGGSIDNPSSAITVVNSLTTGVNVFAWTISNGSCPPSSAQVSVTVDQDPLQADAGSDFSVCEDNTQLNANTPSVGSGVWTLVSGSGTIADITNPASAVNGLGLGQNVFRWTITNGACETFDEVIITRDLAPSPAVVGNDQQICANTASLSAETPLIGTGNWILIAGSADILDPTNPNSPVSNLQAGNNIFQWTVANGACPPSSAQLIISVDEISQFADAGNDINICIDNAILQGNAPTQGTGTWAIVSGSATISDVNDPNASVSDLPFGITVLSWTLQDGSCISTDQLIITVSEGPDAADAGIDQQVCANTIQLNANTPQLGAGVWTLISGSGDISNINDPSTQVSNLGAGLNVFRWTISFGNCPDTFDEVNIVVNENAFSADAGPDQIICQPQTQLAAILPLGSTGVWSFVSGSGTLNDINDPSTVLQELSIGTVVLKWTVTTGACIDSALVTITFSQFPDAANAGPDQTICSDQTVLDANNPEVGNGQWSVITGSALFADANQNNTSVSGLSLGVNVLQWTVSNGACPPSTDQLVIIREDINLEADAGSDFSVCEDNASLAAVEPAIGTGVWSLVSGGATIANPNDINTAISGLSPGANIFQWSVSSGSCPPVVDQVTVTRDVPPSLAAAGPDQIVCGANATLNANEPVIGSGLWTLIAGAANIQNNLSNISLVNNLSAGANVFVWTISNGVCPPSADTVLIEREKNLSPADAGTDQQVCTDNITLNASNPQNGTGVWTLISGSGVIANESAPNTQVTGLSAGINVFRWTVSSFGGACPPSEDEVVITRFLPPSDAIIIEDFSTCQPQANLSAQIPAIGVGVWEVFSGNAIITDPNDANTLVSGLEIGNNVFEWRVSNGVCPSNGALLNITRIENVEAIVNTNIEVCGGDAQLSANLPSGATGTWTLVSGAGNISDTSNPNTTVSGLSTGINTFLWTLNFADCEPVSAIATVTSYEQPLEANAGADINSCGTSAQLQAIAPAIGTGQWSVLSGAATFSDSSNPQSLATDLLPGLNEFIWTVSNGVCPSVSDTVAVNVDETPLTADAGEDQTICVDNTSLSAVPPVIGTGVWTLLSGSGNIDNPNITNPFVNNLGFGSNIFIYTVTSNDCEVFDQVNITRLVPPLAFAGNDTIICSNALQLNANLPPGAIGTWVFISGSGDVSDINAPDANVINLEEGENVLSWTLVLGDCPVSVANITINVSCNTPPVTVNDFFITDEDVAVNGNFMNNNFDPDGTELVADTVPVTGPNNGSVVINADGTFIYTPDPLFNGQDTIVVNVCDNGIPLPAECALDTIIITVNPVNNPPVAINDIAVTNINTPVSGNMLDNNFDPDGTNLTMDTIPTSGPRNGSIVLNNNGDFTYTPNENFLGLDTIVVLVCDSGIPLPQLCVFDTLFVFVNDTTQQETLPVTENDFFVTNEDVAIGGNIMTNNTNPNGNSLVADSIPVSGPSNGSFTISPDGTFTYTPNPDWSGVDTIVVLVCDSLIEPPLCANDTIFITVNAVNDPPVTENDFITTPFNEPVSGNMNDNNFDPEGTDLYVDGIVNGPSNGSIEIDSLGNYTYTPNPGFAGIDTVVVLICDNGIPLPPECSFDTLFVTVLMPNIEVNAGPDQSICGTSALLSGNEVSAPDTAVWTQISGSGAILNPEQNTTLVENLTIGENQFVWSVTSQGFTVSDTVTITVNPPATVANAGTDQIICIDSTALAGNIAVDGTGTWSVITGEGNILSPGQNGSPVNDIQPGFNQFVWTIVNGPCSSSDTVNVVFINIPEPEVPNTASICVGEDFLLPLPSSVEFDYNWTSNNNSVVFGQPTNEGVPVSNLPSSTTIVFTLTASSEGCSASSSFDLVILPINFPACDTTQPIFVPEGFSPNGDNVHDKFVIYNLPDGARVRLQVFNRWGVKVYESNDYKNDWDGTCNVNTSLVLAGDALPESTYYYILEFDFEFNPRVGYLTLWR